MLLVFLSFNDKRRLQLFRHFNIIISIHAQNVFHHVTRTLNIHTIGRNFKLQSLSILSLDNHLQRCHNALDGIMRNLLSDELVHIIILQINIEVGQRLWINILDFHRYLSACQFLTKQGSLFQGIDGSVRINATLESERRISRKAMATGALTNPCGMEISRLQHHVTGGLIGSTTLSAKHAGNTHRLLCIANGQVAVTQFVLFTVKRDERSSLRQGLHHNFMASYHICIKAMQRLSIGHHHIVSDIHDIVDRTEPNSIQFILQPIGRFLYLTVSYTHTGITFACLRVLYYDINGEVMVINGKSLVGWTVKTGLIAVLHQPCIQVASHTPMRKCIGTVSSNINLNEPIALQVVVFSGRLSYRSILRKYDDTIMRSSHTDFVLSTDHTKAFHTAEF